MCHVPCCALSDLDINNAEKKNELKELPGEFNGLKLCFYMYVACRQIATGTDVGIDFSKEIRCSCCPVWMDRLVAAQR